MNRLNFFVISASCVIALLGNQMFSAIAKPAGKNYAEVYKEMLASVIKADSQLANDMETVAETLQEFAQAQGHFPDPGDDIDGLSLELSALLPGNPFLGSGVSSTDANSKSQPASGDFLDEYSQAPTASRAKVVFDPSLNASFVDKLSQEPYSTWRAKPGTVVAVTNGYDLCLVWGAGIDETPVRDASGKVRMAVLKTSY